MKAMTATKAMKVGRPSKAMKAMTAAQKYAADVRWYKKAEKRALKKYGKMSRRGARGPNSSRQRGGGPRAITRGARSKCIF